MCLHLEKHEPYNLETATHEAEISVTYKSHLLSPAVWAKVFAHRGSYDYIYNAFRIA